MAEPIRLDQSGAGLLTSLLGQNTNTNSQQQQVVQNLQNALTQGSVTGTQGGTQAGTSTANTINTANIAPLLQEYARNSGDIDPATMQQIISTIFTEGARAVPELTGQFANSTGSRVRGNSGLNLALTDLNRNLSTQALTTILGENQARRAAAANTAAQVAANTRETAQTGTQQQANTQQTQQQTQQAQQQTGGTVSNAATQQQARQSVNPNMAGLVGVGGTLLNFLDKKGAFGRLFGQGSTTPTAGAGTITGGNSLVQNPGGITMAPATSPVIGAAPSSGLLAGPAAPVSQAPATMSIGGQPLATSVSNPAAAPVAVGSAPVISGGASTPSFGGGSIGSGFNWGAGLSPGFTGGSTFFGGGGLDLSGNTAGVGLNPFDNGGIALGGNFVDTGAGGSVLGAAGDAAGTSWENLPTQAWDYLSGAGGSAIDSIGGFLGGLGDAIGSFFADGGQISTGATAPRVRNMNYMGARPQERRESAINYEGYGPPAGAVGASTPAGGSPSLSAGMAAPGIATLADSGAQMMSMMAPTPATQPVAGTQAISLTPQQIRQAQDQAIINANLAAAQLAQNSAGGGIGGVGEGAAPTQDEASNGAMGIAPGGIAAAPSGTASAIGTGLGLAGMMGPMGSVLSIISALASAVNAANQPSIGMTNAGIADETSAATGAVSSPVSQSSVVGIDLGMLGDTGISSGGLSGAPDEGSQGDAPGVSGVSAGNADDASGGGGIGGESGDSSGNYANGGIVNGAGTGRSDSIRVRSREPGGKTINYSDGEYVIPKDVVDVLGAQHFDRLLDAFHTTV